MSEIRHNRGVADSHGGRRAHDVGQADEPVELIPGENLHLEPIDVR